VGWNISRRAPQGAHLIFDLGPPVNAKAHYRSTIFMYNVTLNIAKNISFLMYYGMRLEASQQNSMDV